MYNTLHLWKNKHKNFHFAKVNNFDLSVFLSKWGSTDATADLNHDGTVNVFDLSALLSHWTG